MVNRSYPEQTSPGEEYYRQIQESIHHARDFQERMQRLARVLDTLAPHNESILARLPRNTDPWPMAKIRASTDGHPTYGETSCNPS